MAQTTKQPKNSRKKTSRRKVATSDENGLSHIDFDDNRLVANLSGDHDSHLALIEDAFDVRIDPRGNRFAITGKTTGRKATEKTLAFLYDQQLQTGVSITVGDVRAAIRLTAPTKRKTGRKMAGNTSKESHDDQINALTIRTPKRTIMPRTVNQQAYLQAMEDHALVFGVGPAGTGKTYLAVAHAVQMLMNGSVERLILTRPALEAGERIGFLPGDMREKVDPYLRPLYDALHDMMDTDFVERRLAAGDIEIAPLGFMRGRTLSRAMVILDEGQNASIMQMKMFLTRLGEGATMVVTGDPSQSDLPDGEPSGLVDALSILKNVDGVAQSMFTAGDVVRHPLVGRIIDAYDKRAKRRKRAKTKSE